MGANDDDAWRNGSERLFKGLVRRLAPLPLQQVYEFQISFHDKFWTERLMATSEELAYAGERGERLVSLRIEEWLSHRVGRTVVSPWSAPAAEGPMTERVKRQYPTRAREPSDCYTLLWHLSLAPYSPESGRGARLELRLDHGTFRLYLCVIHGRFGLGSVPYRDDPTDENVLADVPLDLKDLKPFKRPNEKTDPEESDWENGLYSTPYKAESWRTCYDHRDDGVGLYWELWIHDLQRDHDA